MVEIKYWDSIEAITIIMQPPSLDDNTYKRKTLIESKEDENLILKEEFLRRFAYKNTIIKTGESFYNDSDMKSDYYLIIIYDAKSNTPLLSARYYFDKAIIADCLKGDANSKTDSILNLNEFEGGEIFLADRLSGNISSTIYRHHRNYIYTLLYSQIFKHNKNCKFILMARKEKQEKLMKKYLRLGLEIIGSTVHKSKEHWILLGDVMKCYEHIKKSNTLLSKLIEK